MSLLTKIFGSRNQRLLKQLQKFVRAINALEPELEKLSDDALKAKTPELKARLAGGAAGRRVKRSCSSRRASGVEGGGGPWRRHTRPAGAVFGSCMKKLQGAHGGRPRGGRSKWDVVGPVSRGG
jgi:hypothetical protein